VQPQLVKKDFYLTRLLWALAQSFGDALLLKRDALARWIWVLSVSEDADLVLPGGKSAEVANVDACTAFAMR